MGSNEPSDVADDVLHLVGRVSIAPLHAELKREAEHTHHVELPGNEASHHHHVSHEGCYSHDHSSVVQAPVVKQQRLPDSVELVFGGTDLTFELIDVVHLESGIGVEVGQYVVLGVEVGDLVLEIGHNLSLGVVGVGAFTRNFTFDG